MVNRGLLMLIFQDRKTCHHFEIYFLAIPTLGIVVQRALVQRALVDQALPRRPVHVSAAEQMQMQVVHGLAAIVTRIHDDAITIVQLLFARNLRRSGHQVADQWRIFGQRLRRGTEVLFGDNQKMRGRLGVDVGKADATFVFVHTVRRYGA
jgi:hypothetical protein